MRRVDVRPLDPGRPFSAVVRVPGSKSITNRALLCAALCPGRTVLEGVGLSEDSRHMAESLRRLGAGVEESAQGPAMVVDGLGAPPVSTVADPPILYVGNAGTAARFLPCMAAAGRGRFRFDSDERMRRRPMGPLLDVLEAQGALVTPLDGGPSRARAYPFLLEARGLKGGTVRLDLTESSQFASGLLMAAPFAETRLAIEAAGGRTQYPYVDMTAAVMGAFGAGPSAAPGSWSFEPGPRYRSPGTYRIEPDLSGAAYFFAAAALAPGFITVRGVDNASIQGDLRFLKVLQHMGVGFFHTDEGLAARAPESGTLRGGMTVDMNSFSDQALTLAALAPFADAPVRITNIGHIRRQECDRIAAIVENLGALGVEALDGPDWVEVRPWAPGARRGAALRTFGDHRVAMAFALVGLAVPGVSLDDADCVGKTFEGYWGELDRLREAQASGT